MVGDGAEADGLVGFGLDFAAEVFDVPAHDGGVAYAGGVEPDLLEEALA
jgi:hypothetical protein